MSTVGTIILILHTFIAVLIIALVLLQRGKGADAGAAFGSGAYGTVFGSRGSASFFSRATAILATAFFASSLALAYFSSENADTPDSLLERMPADRSPATRGGEPAPGAAEGTNEAADQPASGDLPALPESQEPASDEPS